MPIFPAGALFVAVAAVQAPGSIVDPNSYEQLPVGDPRIDASRLRPYEAQWRIVETGADGKSVEVERSSEKVDVIRQNGRKLWRQVQHEISGNTGTSDLLVLTDHRSFAPLVADQRDVRDGSLKQIRYNGSTVTIECGGHLCPPKMDPPAVGTASKTFATDAAPFDYWGGTFGLLFATLPLKAGAKYSIPVFHPVQGLIRLRVEVTGEEVVSAGGGRKMKAFRIVTPQTGWIYHVSKSPPYWLRLEYHMQAKPGVVQVTERI